MRDVGRPRDAASTDTGHHRCQEPPHGAARHDRRDVFDRCRDRWEAREGNDRLARMWQAHGEDVTNGGSSRRCAVWRTAHHPLTTKRRSLSLSLSLDSTPRRRRAQRHSPGALRRAYAGGGSLARKERVSMPAGASAVELGGSYGPHRSDARCAPPSLVQDEADRRGERRESPRKWDSPTQRSTRGERSRPRAMGAAYRRVAIWAHLLDTRRRCATRSP